MLAVSTSSPHVMMLRRKNTWYSVKDGNWSDPSVWISNAVNRHNVLCPRAGDDVYMYHNIIFDLPTVSLNNLYVSGVLSFSGSRTTQLVVLGELTAPGTIDQSVNNLNTLALYGTNTYMPNYISGSQATTLFGSKFNKLIPSLSYNNLNITGNGYSYINAPLTTNGDLAILGNLDSNNFLITVNGKMTVNVILPIPEVFVSGNIISSGNLLFIGQVVTGGGRGIGVTGTASIECRGGMGLGNGNFDATNSNINFTTNSQSLTMFNASLIANNYTITGAITITNVSGANTPLIVNGTMNGTVAGSTLNNDGIIQFNSRNAQMTTGVFNYKHGAGSTVAYNLNGGYTLPYTQYENLTINNPAAGTPWKFSGNTTVNGKLGIIGNGVSGACSGDLESNNLTVNGVTLIGGFFLLKKTGAGNCLFVGQLTGSTAGGCDFTGGNPTIEFRGGAAFTNFAFASGTGAISVTTNSQTWDSSTYGAVINGNLTIASGITLTSLSVPVSGGVLVFNAGLNGADASSIFINNGNVNYSSAAAPMSTGKLYANQAVNKFTYGNGAQDITAPSDPVNPGYSSLTLNGTGVKRLLGNVSVKDTYVLTSPATLNLNGFSLTNP